MKQVKGWWFAAEKKLPHGDGRKIIIGKTHKVKGEVIPCRNGLHLSTRVIDALNYAPGPIIYRVVGSGVIVPHGDPVDKYACSERTYIAGGLDLTDTLRLFARKCALDVIHLWEAPEIVVRYLKTGDETIRAAAWSAARAAEWSAARDAARGAVWSAAWDAARDAAWDAARDAEWAAAWDAEWAAAWSAARDAARKKQNRRLERMIKRLI